VHDALETGRSQRLTQRRRLGAPERAEREAVEVPVQDAVRVLDVRVPD
jgi:hypothetical protein